MDAENFDEVVLKTKPLGTMNQSVCANGGSLKRGDPENQSGVSTLKWRFPRMMVAQQRWMVYFMENPSKMDDD